MSFYSSHFHLASVGVGFFIVLSGFLITWIILEEYQNTGKFNSNFYLLRRTLRIWPLYFLAIIVGFVIVIGARQYYNLQVHDVPPLPYLLTFTLNIYMANHGSEFLFCIAFLWSISMEEQFYILWGFLLKVMKDILPFICYGLILTSIVFRYIKIEDNNGLYFNSINWIGNFAIGSLLAYYAINGKLSKFENIPTTIRVMVYVLFFIMLVFYNSIFSSTIMTILERFIGALFFAFILFEQSFSQKPLFSLNKSKILSHLGKISYGLFVYHGFVILLFSKLVAHFGWLNVPTMVFLIIPLVTFAMTIVISALSYKYFEKPIMRLRYKIKPV